MEKNNEIFEAAFVFGEGSVGAVVNNDQSYKIIINYAIAYKNLETNEIIEHKHISINTFDTDTNYYFETFSEKNIMKLKVRECNDGSIYKRFELIEVIEQNYKDEDLQNILNKYLEPVETLDNFILNKGFDRFEKDIDWVNNKKVRISFYNDDEDIDTCIETARKIEKNKKELDKQIKEYAAEELFEDAEDWESEVTEEEFINLINIDIIKIDYDSIAFWLDDGEIFGGHSIIIYTDTDFELEGSELAG
ncbi:DUF2262 domain-containing protein [Campylobacter lari]|uniref:DUF2262 domain-containing protein n=1 Tax=Campylobacter lari TaxID=201 RepID=UPI002153689E|nr:DUF2262 domain-containing protein [Campylobacter lari]MCR6513164.1 DUF2262 domain-containing protein [Campylobacter lari]